MVKKELLDIMCCPACKSDVEEKDGKVVCLKCGRRYPIENDIPVMLVEEAELPDDESETKEKKS